MNVNFHKSCENTDKILEISRKRCNFVKFDILFLGLPYVIFFGVITSIALKNVKKNAICFKLWYKVFVH